MSRTMSRTEAKYLSVLSLVAGVVGAWTLVGNAFWRLDGPRDYGLLLLATPSQPVLILSTIAGLAIGAVVSFKLQTGLRTEFRGAEYERHLRGPKLVSGEQLAKASFERGKQQVYIGAVPVPTESEGTHLALIGSTGSGKSVALRSVVSSFKRRGDRIVAIDPDGDMYSRFAQPGDVLLNPFDARAPGWSLFNEIRTDYDYERIALSVIPPAPTPGDESWYGYARTMLAALMRKLALSGDPNIRSVYAWGCTAPVKLLHKFLKGTPAESQFVGDASRALGSTRYILGQQLEPHLRMPRGSSSLRDWLDEGKGSLYITWTEETRVILKPIISTWADILAAHALSMPETRKVRAWFSYDELASLDKMSSIEDMLAKGRKHGFPVLAAFHSISQLRSRYGREDAQSLLSCFKSFAAFSGAKADHDTREFISQALGEHEVQRIRRTSTRGSRGSDSTVTETQKERVVLPSQIAQLDNLSCYLAFSGARDIGVVDIPWVDLPVVNKPFVARPDA